MRIAHRHDRHEDSVIADRQRPQGVVTLDHAGQTGLVEWHVGRHEARRAHVDRDAAIVFQARADDPRHGLHTDAARLCQPLVDDKAHEGARAVAALLDLTAIVVEDAIAKVHPRVSRAFHDQDLVGPDAEAAVGQAAPLIDTQVDLLVDRIDNDEVVAGAVHLGKFQFHGFNRTAKVHPAAGF
jgi:hypothetical protein